MSYLEILVLQRFASLFTIVGISWLLFLNLRPGEFTTIFNAPLFPLILCNCHGISILVCVEIFSGMFGNEWMHQRLGR
jgi:hypothetical protein